MTGNKLLSQIVLSLNSYLGFNDQDLEDMIDIDEDLEGAILSLLDLSPPSIFESFLFSIDKIRSENIDNFLSTPYSLNGGTEIIDFSQNKFKNKNRSFSYSDIEFGFVSSKVFFDNGNIIDFSNKKYALVWKQIEEYLERCYSILNTTAINSFFDMITHLDNDKGLVLNKTAATFNEDRHYPYIYLCFLNNSNSIYLPDNLVYTTDMLSSQTIYDDTKNYEQFFDVYDVINELNQAPDILNRFLRLYHSFEYLVYRVYLVKLVERVGQSKIFVREFIGSAESMKKQEKPSFLNNFKTIFTSDLVSITSDLNPVTQHDVIAFLASNHIVKGFDTTDIKKIAELIYGLRCCIVHNKESEYHMTISNSEDYEIIIPLIKKILEVFENLLIEKIINNDPTITYSQPSVDLY